MRKPEIRICSLKKLYQIFGSGPQPGCAAVLSSSSQLDAGKLGGLPYVFRKYDDVDMEIAGRSFSPDDAQAFSDFVRGLGPDVETIFCCCDAGESRSPAVAAAVSRYFELDDDAIWKNPCYHPNMLVFDLLATALGNPVSDEEKDILLYENHRVFVEAIRKS